MLLYSMCVYASTRITLRRVIRVLSEGDLSPGRQGHTDRMLAKVNWYLIATGLPPDCHRIATGLPPDCCMIYV